MHIGKNNVMAELLPQISILSLQNVRHFLKQPGKVQNGPTTANLWKILFMVCIKIYLIFHKLHGKLSMKKMPLNAWFHGFKEWGLFIKSGYPYLATSPDGLFNCKCCGLSTIEVKCPYSVRGDDILESHVYKRVNFLEEFDGQPRLRGTQKYFTQVQAQMWVCNVQHSSFYCVD